MKSVVVSVRNRDAGILAKFRDGSYEFRYTRQYRRDATTPSVAFSLPKSRGVHRSRVLFPFFYGLMAEGAQKRLQCRQLKIDEADHFTRLAETCRQGVIGAVWVQPRKGLVRREELP